MTPARPSPSPATGRGQGARVSLSDHTTFHLGGPAARFVEVTTPADLVEAVRAADATAEPLFVLSGGSNVLVADAGFPGTVIHLATRGVAVTATSGEDLRLTVQAGHPWDELVALAVAEGWSGIEALSGIPGLVGATPIQNVGAYGAEVAQVIESVRVYDRLTGRIEVLPGAACGFGYRDSLFKRARGEGEPTGRHVVVDVGLRLRASGDSAPIAYAELARALGVEAGRCAPLRDVREAVLGLRASKGMVVDEADHDTWSAGSFFTNPVVDAATAARLPAEAPRYPQPDGTVKTSAAWLIEHAGLGKGWGIVHGRPDDSRTMGRGGAPATEAPAATLSTKHVLALTNRGTATADDVVSLAWSVIGAVRTRWSIDLVPEPVVVGMCLVDPLPRG